MGPRYSILIIFVAFISVAQGLMCNFCQSIERNDPNCEQIEERECRKDLTHCIRIIMHEPAYGEVRRCASITECESQVPHVVERECCDTDFCN